MKVKIYSCGKRLLLEGEIEPSTRVPMLNEHIVVQDVELIVHKISCPLTQRS